MKAVVDEYLVVYSGHNMAAYLYQKLLKKSCKVELVPTPTKILYGCSQSIRFKEECLATVLNETQKMKTPPKGVYKIIKTGKFNNYEKI
jgi:hypothetical protein